MLYYCGCLKIKKSQKHKTQSEKLKRESGSQDSSQGKIDLNIYSVEQEKLAFDPSSVSTKLTNYSAIAGGEDLSEGDQMVDGKSFVHFKYEHLQDGKIK